MEKKGTISEAGVLYIPRPVRREIGRKVTLIDAPNVVLVFSQRSPLKRILRSLNVLKEDLQLRQSEEELEDGQ
ncbi:hypothetical protein AKJ45_02570 [candidate division MSBL1 archaeon SCGC-AAA261F19]|uniref:Uncharacterized protein n=1 Tax=candidate division MSBL1 archaeon SCGC-AAA261F19 TaxID=1698275 RepID=A0A133V9J0_9EURY|nr:hypothetical protein AKJ45_02570 [candidate division MSBL1 archaeon SCGC-AAA261F19]